ncbi:tripartite tricarboxylate transporter TctB family protein [Rhizobium jaguaris]|uniref:tripartite tricarboxylate transporter TctB family protein n=1 Tax=Rhizobium jaguaris TaxID=1312183 RepID=UPI0039BF918E
MFSRDVAGGLLMMVVGSAFSYFGWAYDVGTLSQMGPGFMPVALGGILVLLGLLILVNGLGFVVAGANTGKMPRGIAAKQKDGAVPQLGEELHHSGGPLETIHWPDWRGLAAIVLAIVAFVMLAEKGGLIVATFAVVFISALGDRNNRLQDALLLAAWVTVFGVAVFYYGLQIRLPLLPSFR